MRRYALSVFVLGLAVALSVGVAIASAGGGTITCANAALTVRTTSNVDIPAGKYCNLFGEFQGTVTVEGYAEVNSATFDKNVNVIGGSIAVPNGIADFKGNLNISGSNGVPGVATNNLVAYFGPVTIEGNLNYIGNFVPLYVATQAPLSVHVLGNFTYSGNAVPWDATQGAPTGPLVVDGQSSIS